MRRGHRGAGEEAVVRAGAAAAVLDDRGRARLPGVVDLALVAEGVARERRQRLDLPAAALAQSCGDDASGFDAWKAQFAQTAAANGVGQAGLDALAGASYASRTIEADRNQRSFRYELSEFMRIRGSDTIVAQGRQRLAENQAFYDSLEAAYGVPAGVLIAIHGMETG